MEDSVDLQGDTNSIMRSMIILSAMNLRNFRNAILAVSLGLAMGLGVIGKAEGAAQVNWGSERFATNLTSEGMGHAMGANFTFELGAFDPGFTPTASNRHEWMARWHPAGSSSYAETYRFFAGSVAVDTGSPVFAPSNRGYIWGFDTRSPGGPVEWVLITNPDWRWPVASELAMPLDWCVNDAIAVVGWINSPDGTCHIQSERLDLAGADPNDPVVWRDGTFGSSAGDETVAGWSADPDGDGRSNLLEFALGTSALEGDGEGGMIPGIEHVDGSAYQTLSIARRKRPAVDYVPEVSSDLGNWSSGAADVEILEDTETRLVLRAREPRSAGRCFLRLRVHLRVED